MLKPFRQQIFPVIAAVGVIIAHSGQVSAQTFVPIKEPECLSNVSPLFTTGGQYVDANNGVLDNSWSMLARWQGSDFVQNPVSYDISTVTRMNYADAAPWGPSAPPVGSLSNWQRGVQPESLFYSTPGVQLYCDMMGMLINTWWVPHVNIVGGGYNDMFGYSWSNSGSPAPDAFVIRNDIDQQVVLETDLVVQADIAVPALYTYKNSNNPDARPTPAAQVALFAYVFDITNPNLHPIALVSGTHDTQPLTNSETVRCDYSTGVYFAGSNTGTALSYFTHDPYSAYPQALVDKNNPGEPYQFFRLRVTPNNFRNIINTINAYGSGCPTAGYSTDISNYKIKYAGVISEMVLFDQRFDAILNDPNKDQISIGVKAKDVGVFRRY